MSESKEEYLASVGIEEGPTKWDFKTYQREALKTCSLPPQSTEIPVEFLSYLMTHLVSGFTLLDQIKKNLIYGKPIDDDDWYGTLETMRWTMTELEQFKFRSGITKPLQMDFRLVHAFLTMFTETGEVAHLFRDALLKDGFTKDDRFDLSEELGDIEWARAILYDALGETEQDIRAMNVAKIRARYGEKFSQDKAKQRDKKAEREAMRNAIG